MQNRQDPFGFVASTNAELHLLWAGSIIFFLAKGPRVSGLLLSLSVQDDMIGANIDSIRAEQQCDATSY